MGEIMDYIKIRFGSELDQLNAGFERNLEEMFRAFSPRFTCTECSWTPPMDIFETADHVVIFAEVAGVKKDDLEIEVNSKAVKISGRRTELPRVEKATYRLAEIQCGRFERTLFLPTQINTEEVTATCENGMLRLELAKMPVKKTHNIPISES